MTPEKNVFETSNGGVLPTPDGVDAEDTIHQSQESKVTDPAERIKELEALLQKQIDESKSTLPKEHFADAVPAELSEEQKAANLGALVSGDSEEAARIINTSQASQLTERQRLAQKVSNPESTPEDFTKDPAGSVVDTFYKKD